VRNRFLGKSVTVANLLAGRDIASALNGISQKPYMAILPPRVINMDGLFLDGMTLREIAQNAGIHIAIAPENAADIWKIMRG